MTGRRAAYAAPLTVAVVLVALAVATTLGFLAIMRANARVTEARNLVTLHLAAQNVHHAHARHGSTGAVAHAKGRRLRGSRRPSGFRR